MDHCRNASEPDRAGDPLLGVSEPREPDEEPAAEAEPWTFSGNEGTIHGLDRLADELRQRHLEAALTSLAEREDLDAADRAAIADCSRGIVDGVLRGPRQRFAADEGKTAAVAADLFDFDD